MSVANICPLLVTLIAIISPCISSSCERSVVRCLRGRPDAVGSVTSPSSFTDSSCGIGVCEAPFDPPRSASSSPSSSPSLDTRVVSRFPCLVAAKTEGEEIGQYVMALFRQSTLHPRWPSHSGLLLFAMLMLVCMLQGLGGCVGFGGVSAGACKLRTEAQQLWRMRPERHKRPVGYLCTRAIRHYFTQSPNSASCSAVMRSNMPYVAIYGNMT